jgi:hypothetical protein
MIACYLIIFIRKWRAGLVGRVGIFFAILVIGGMSLQQVAGADSRRQEQRRHEGQT